MPSLNPEYGADQEQLHTRPFRATVIIEMHILVHGLFARQHGEDNIVANPDGRETEPGKLEN